MFIAMSHAFNPELPSIEHLQEKARKRMPRFAYEYLSGGCFSEINIRRNTDDIREVQLRPYYLRDYPGSNMEAEIFGKKYSAPFGVSPIGLQGLMWPRATEILAKSAFEHNIPFILSTVAELTEGNAWFQLYHPAEESMRDKLLQPLCRYP